MDIGGINRLKAAFGMRDRPEIEKSKNANADRDAHGGGGRQRTVVQHLSPEQEEEALKRLNLQPAFVTANLKAILVREEGKRPHILVRKITGEVVRKLPYEQIIRIYLNETEENSTGLLLKKSA